MPSFQPTVFPWDLNKYLEVFGFVCMPAPVAAGTAAPPSFVASPCVCSATAPIPC